jgi:hypothetical protein
VGDSPDGPHGTDENALWREQAFDFSLFTHERLGRLQLDLEQPVFELRRHAVRVDFLRQRDRSRKRPLADAQLKVL